MATPIELRLVETPHGMLTAVKDAAGTRAAGRRMSVGLLLTGLVAMAFMASALPVLSLMFIPLVLAVLLGLPRTVHTHLQIGPKALTLRRMRVRGLSDHPSLDQILNGTDASWLIQRGDPPQTVPWSDVRDLGYTDHGLWMERDDGERLDWQLDTLTRADIQRLHDTLHAVWTRSRESLTDTVEDAARARQALQGLKA